MLKKLDISEKLKKISDEEEKKGPLLRPKKVSELKKRPIAPFEVSRQAEPDTHVSEKAPLEAYRERIEGGIEEFLITERDGLKVSPKFKEIEKDKLEQVFILEKKTPVEMKWTVIKDPFAEEFSLLTRELKLVKTAPPIYASEFENARIASSHIGLYTMTLGSFKLELEDLVKVFVQVLQAKALIQG